MQTNWNRALDSFRDGMINIYNNTVITPTIVIKMWGIGLFSHYNEQLSDANVMSHYRK